MNSIKEFIGNNGGDISFGLIAGFAVGYTLKKFSKIAALLLGIVFIAVQWLSYKGYISINWHLLEKNFQETIHSVNSNSGFFNYLVNSLPFASGFGVGMLIGFKKG